MKLYIIRAWNSAGGGIGNYYVVAPGVNAAKRKVREAEPIAKRVECIDERPVLIAEAPAVKICEYSGLPALESYTKK